MINSIYSVFSLKSCIPLGCISVEEFLLQIRSKHMNFLEPNYEMVYAIFDVHDIPTKGIADYNGVHHSFERMFDIERDDFDDFFTLFRIENRTFELAMEHWKNWRKWESDASRGKKSIDTHPALAAPTALSSLLNEKLSITYQPLFYAYGEFKERYDPNFDGFGSKPQQVKWTVK
jgi:hypothetical protein